MISVLARSSRVRLLLRGAAAALVCAAGTFLFARRLDEAYPISEWLIWRLAPIWGYALLFNVACVCFGAFLARRLLADRALPAIERLLQSMMLGLTAFVLGLYALGFAHLFKPASAVALPAVFIVVGAQDGLALVKELVGWRASIAPPQPLERVLGTVACGAGAVAILLLYLESLDTSVINYDATWYHFPIAQDYVREGRIVPFPGDNHRAFPHLTSLVHTWALLVPKLPVLSQHWMLSLHLELTIVLWRIVGAAALARWLLGDRDVRGLWATFFLFPSIFVYDQSIGGSADHFLGFFAVPVLLAAARAWRSFDVRWCVLLGVALGGHVLVKYQGVYLFAAVAVVTAGRLAFLAARSVWRRRRGEPAELTPRLLLRGVAALALTFTLVSAAHFGKNAAFYRNPVYPFAQKIFTASTPKATPGYYREAPAKQAFEPQGKGLRRQVWAVKKLFTYPLETANRNLTKKRPYMGALFSLLLPCAVLCRGRRRLAVAAGVGFLSFMVWANSAPNDRYLLSFLDLFIGTTAALIVEVWELGYLARIGLVPVVLLQLVWGGDAALYYGRQELESALDLIGRGYDGRYDERLSARGTQRQITRATPSDAVILSRNYKGLLGLDRTVLMDIRGGQDYVSYSGLADTRQLYELLKSRGVTHLLYPKNQRRPVEWNSTILFTDLYERYAVRKQRFGKLQLGELPKGAPPPARPFLVVATGIRGVKDGIWELPQLDFDPRSPQRFSPSPRPKYPISEVHERLGDVQALIVGRRRPDGLTDGELSSFEQAEAWDGEQLWLRR